MKSFVLLFLHFTLRFDHPTLFSLIYFFFPRATSPPLGTPEASALRGRLNSRTRRQLLSPLSPPSPRPHPPRLFRGKHDRRSLRRPVRLTTSPEWLPGSRSLHLFYFILYICMITGPRDQQSRRPFNKRYYPHSLYIVLLQAILRCCKKKRRKKCLFSS